MHHPRGRPQDCGREAGHGNIRARSWRRSICHGRDAETCAHAAGIVVVEAKASLSIADRAPLIVGQPWSTAKPGDWRALCLDR